MAVEREIPDSHVVCLADQFCDTATMLYGAIPNAGPQAMRVNAVFAVEFYIKSLDCHWVRHNQLQTSGVDCDLIATKPNKRGHELDKLFDHLEDWAKTYYPGQVVVCAHALCVMEIRRQLPRTCQLQPARSNT